MLKIKFLIFSLLLINNVIAESNISKTKKVVKEKTAKTVRWIKNHKTVVAASIASISTAAVYLKGFYKLYTLGRCNNKQLFFGAPTMGLQLLMQGKNKYFYNKLNNFNLKLWHKLSDEQRVNYDKFPKVSFLKNIN